MTGAGNGAATLGYGYNARDELVRETTTLAGLGTLETTHGYDAAGNRTRIGYPGGSAFVFEHDELERLRFVRSSPAGVPPVPPGLLPLVEERSYDPLSRVVTRRLASGGEETYGYDRLSRLTSLDYAVSGSPVDALAYSFDVAGDVTSRTDLHGAQLYTHDATHQLLVMDPPAASPLEDVSLVYDDAGNRVTETRPSGTTAYVTNALNQYPSVGGTTRSHDTNGNLTSDGSATYTFDAESRLSAASVPGPTGPTTASYAYDPFMRRVSKTVNGTVTYFLWSGDDLVEERSGTNTLLRRYVYAGGFAPVRVEDPGLVGSSVMAVHTDHLGTPRFLSDGDGVPVWRADAEAFGRALISPDPDGDPATPNPGIAFHLRLPGQYFDAETGLHYNRFRYYDPMAGRYVGADPLGQEAGDSNLYAYSFNSPVLWSDALGLASLKTSIKPDGTSVTTFDPRPEDSDGSSFSINTRNHVTGDSRPGADGEFTTEDVSVLPTTHNPRAYGPDGTYIDTGDPRGRDIHGGGSCPAVADSQAPRQGWCPTRGCTRGQNEDVKALADRIKDFHLGGHPKAAKGGRLKGGHRGARLRR